MSLTQKRINQIIKEELNRALADRGMNEMTDDAYNDYLQQQHGRFTSPENVPGTPEYRARQAAMNPPSVDRPRSPPAPPTQWDDYSWYEGLSRFLEEGDADDDMPMDTDMGMDVVPDEDMSGEDMGMDMGDEAMMEPLEQEIDWTQFEDDDADAVGAAFLDAVKQLQEEVPEESPSAEAVVARMQELLAGESEEDMGMDDEMGIEEEEPTEDMDEEKGEDHGAMNEWVRRANLLAGTSRSR